MNYGYPGANSQFENHNVSEESFWPSFTDIMMVIVMVFLLVTVAVILNNWALISKLTTSIEAQQVASDLAENRQTENTNLENKLSAIQQKLLVLNAQFKKEKSSLEETEIKLKSAAATLSTKEQSLVSIENKLGALNEKYESEHQRFTNTNEQLSASEQKLSNTDKQLIEIKQQLANKVTIIASLDEKLLSAEKLNTKTQGSLVSTQKNLEAEQKKLVNTNVELSELQAIYDSTQKNLDSEQNKLVDTNAELRKLKATYDSTQKNLDSEQNKLVDTNAELTKLKVSLIDLKNEKQSLLETSASQTKEIEEKSEAATALQIDRKNLDEKLTEVLASIKLAEQTIATNKKSHTKVEAELLKKLTLLQSENEDKNKTIKETESSQVGLKTQLEKKSEQLTLLQTTFTESQQTLEEIEASVIKSEDTLEKFETMLSESQQQLAAKDKTIKALTDTQDSANSLEKLEALLAESQQQLAAKDETINKLSSAQESGNSQLRSLQGEYDTLDSKYQKLLLPARSSKGKYVASVTYKKVGGKKVIRFKPSPNSSYRTVNKEQLAKNLNTLKKKHKKDLYVKVVIPKNSGLSYNEAWRFTINLQRKYDYYYND